MKSLEATVHSYLKENPLARWRRNKDRALAFIIQRDHPSLASVPPKVLTELVGEILTLDRYWRKQMALNEEWQKGTDYDTKQIVEQRKELELGVSEIGFNQKIVV